MTELNSHSGRCLWALRSRANPNDLTHSLDGLSLAQHQLEAQKSANRSGVLTLDEHAASREVRRMAFLGYLLGIELESNRGRHWSSGILPKLVLRRANRYHSSGMLADRFRHLDSGELAAAW